MTFITGLIPSKVKDQDHSVFSRLDFKPSVSSHQLPSMPLPEFPAVTESTPQHKRRIIQLSKPSRSSAMLSNELAAANITNSLSPLKDRIIAVRQERPTSTLYSDQLPSDVSSTLSSSRKRDISIRRTLKPSLYSDQLGSDYATSIPSDTKRAVSVLHPPTTSRSLKLPAARWINSDVYPRESSERLGTRERERSRSPTSSGGHLGSYSRSSFSLGSGRVLSTSKKTGLFEYEPSSRSAGRTGVFKYEPQSRTTKRTGLFEYKPRGDLGRRDAAEREGREAAIRSSHRRHKESTMGSTMVADKHEYQLQRHRDIRSRLEQKEKERATRRAGPLAGRLGSHRVFGRLE